MKKLPIKYYKYKSLKDRYERCLFYREKLYGNKLLVEERPDAFWAIKTLFNFYIKNLQYMYKLQGKEIILPVEVLKAAQKDKIINCADIWMEFIKDYNIYWQENDEAKQQSIELKIMDKYYRHIDLINKIISTPEALSLIEENELLEQELINSNLVLDDSEPLSYNLLGITEKSYNKLINYFKSMLEIKTVWAHGSRLYKTNSRGSDIDLLIDCPVENWQKVYTGLINLAIPYIVDVKNINMPEKQEYIKTIMCLGTKKIFQTN